MTDTELLLEAVAVKSRRPVCVASPCWDHFERQIVSDFDRIVPRGTRWLWWRLPQRYVAGLALKNPQARADVEDNFRKTSDLSSNNTVNHRVML
jgi:hypothetical protein